jgi:hypothetical protein
VFLLGTQIPAVASEAFHVLRQVPRQIFQRSWDEHSAGREGVLPETGRVDVPFLFWKRVLHLFRWRLFLRWRLLFLLWRLLFRCKRLSSWRSARAPSAPRDGKSGSNAAKRKLKRELERERKRTCTTSPRPLSTPFPPATLSTRNWSCTPWPATSEPSRTSWTDSSPDRGKSSLQLSSRSSTTLRPKSKWLSWRVTSRKERRTTTAKRPSRASSSTWHKTTSGATTYHISFLSANSERGTEPGKTQRRRGTFLPNWHGTSPRFCGERTNGFSSTGKKTGSRSSLSGTTPLSAWLWSTGRAASGPGGLRSSLSSTRETSLRIRAACWTVKNLSRSFRGTGALKVEWKRSTLPPLSTPPLSTPLPPPPSILLPPPSTPPLSSRRLSLTAS